MGFLATAAWEKFVKIAQCLLKINIQRLRCTVIKFHEVLYFGQDF